MTKFKHFTCIFIMLYFSFNLIQCMYNGRGIMGGQTNGQEHQQQLTEATRPLIYQSYELG